MRKLLFSLTLLGCIASAAAESLYVNDIVRVNVRDEPGQAAKVTTMVVTGMELEALGQQDGYVKVRTPEGLEGWIKDDYLTSERPARLQLDEVRARDEGAAEELAAVQARLREAEAENQRLMAQLTALEQQMMNAPEGAAEGTPAGGDGPLSELRFKLVPDTLVYWIGGILFIVLLGFVSGISWHKRHVSRRLGGLRI